MQSKSAAAASGSLAGANRAFFLPRLAQEFYQGDAAVHWTMPIAMRSKGWLDDTFHMRFREMVFRILAP